MCRNEEKPLYLQNSLIGPYKSLNGDPHKNLLMDVYSSIVNSQKIEMTWFSFSVTETNCLAGTAWKRRGLF